MHRQDWQAIIEGPESQQRSETVQAREIVLEVCGLDCHEHLFIERTSARTDAGGIREFQLKAAVELDGIVSIRPVPEGLIGENKISPTLFRICKVGNGRAARIVRALPFEPLPAWSRPARSAS